MEGSPKTMPCSAISLVSAITLAACSNAFDGNAADVEADAAQRFIAFHQHRLLAEIGGPESRAVSTGAGAQHHHLGVNVAFGRGLRRRLGGGLRVSPLLRFFRRGGGVFSSCSFGGSERAVVRALFRGRFQGQDQVTLGHLVADLDLDFGHGSGRRRRHLHGRLVAFQRNQRILRADRNHPVKRGSR